MKLAHTVTLKVFVKKASDEESYQKAMLSLIPFEELEKEESKEKLQKSIKTSKTIAEGFESKIIILEAKLEKEKHTTKFLEFLKSKLSKEDLNQILTQENRVDDECFLYIRLDKKNLLEGNFKLTDSGDCFHIKISLAAFPKKKTSALQVVKKIFS